MLLLYSIENCVGEWFIHLLISPGHLRGFLHPDRLLLLAVEMVWLALGNDSHQSLPVHHCKKNTKNYSWSCLSVSDCWTKLFPPNHNWFTISRYVYLLGKMCLPFRCQCACLYIGTCATFIFIFKWNRWFVVIVCASFTIAIAFAQIICVQAVHTNHWIRC